MQMQVSGTRFWQIVNAVAGSAAKDDSRPILAAINIRVEGKQLRLTAADGFRYSEIELSGVRCDGGGEEDETVYTANAVASDLVKLAALARKQKIGDRAVFIERETTGSGVVFWNVVIYGDSHKLTLIDCDFPDARSSFATMHPRLLFSCSAKYLRDLCDQAVKGQGSGHNGVIHVFALNEPQGVISPTLIRYDDDQRDPEANPELMIARSVLMPVVQEYAFYRVYIDPNWPHPGPGFGVVPDQDIDVDPYPTD